MLIDFVRSEIQFKGIQCSFARGLVKRPVRHRSSVQQSSDQQSLSISPVCGWVEISEPTADTDIPIAQLDQDNMSGLEEMVRQLQDSMKAMLQDAVQQAVFAKQQAVGIAQQSETIARLE